jgi:hypothetical protein
VDFVVTICLRPWLNCCIREIILERAKGYRQTLKGLRSEYEAAKAQHEREMLFCRSGGGDDDEESGNARYFVGYI